MIEPLYVAAREVLLDALDALGEQREALILAGAQAIYIHTGAAQGSTRLSGQIVGGTGR